MVEPAKQTTLDGVDDRLVRWWGLVNPIWRERSKLKLIIAESIRSQERQDYLYSLGRTLPGGKVTWVQQSNHQDGRALDVYILGENRALMGNTDLEMAAYRWLADIGSGLVEGVSNLGLRSGKDWFHWEVR